MKQAQNIRERLGTSASDQRRQACGRRDSDGVAEGAYPGTWREYLWCVQPSALLSAELCGISTRPEIKTR